jgi:competence protein ComEC
LHAGSAVSIGLVLALGVVAGAAAAMATDVAPPRLYAAALAAVSAALLTDRRVVQRAFVIGGIAAAVAGRSAQARDTALYPPLAEWLEATRSSRPASGPVQVVGRLVRDAEPFDRGARLQVDVVSVETRAGPVAARGRVQAYVGGELADRFMSRWTAGRSIRAPVTLRRPRMTMNPGGPGVRWQSVRRRFDLSGTIKSATLITVERGRWWDEAAAAVRAHVRRAVGHVFAKRSGETAAIVTAILIGDRAGLDPQLERRLQVAGTYHVIAISGSNVAVVTGLSLLGLRILLRSPRAVSAATMTMVAGYGWIVGGDPSVSRAVTAAIVYLTAGLVGLVPAALHVLAVVAMLVLIADPLTIADAGAWLSFGATLGIILSVRRLAHRWASVGWGQSSIGSRAGRALTGLLAATIAVDLILLPVTTALFSRVGIAGLLLNFVAIPMIGIVQIGGALAVVLAGWCEWGAALAGLVTHLAATLLVGSTRLVDLVPWLSWRVPAPSLGVIVAFYVCGALWLAGVRFARLPHGAAVAFALSGAVIAFAPTAGLGGPARGRLRLTMLDVGQGEALLLQVPTGRAVLIDAGPSSARFDSGERVVAPALWASGARRIDYLAFTHPDADHIGGATALAGLFGPREVWEGAPVPADDKRQALKDAAGRRRAGWRQLQRDDRIEFGGVSLEVLHPPMPDWERRRVRNDDSLVVRVRYGEAELLLTGDVSAQVEALLPIEPDRWPLRVLKVAHHGSRSSSSIDFLRRYAPQVALVSAGEGNPFGHPSPEVLRRLADIGARVFRTDLDGAIVIETDGRELAVRSMTGRRWTMAVWRRVP